MNNNMMVEAKFNMTFDESSFCKNHTYSYYWDSIQKKYYVMNEQKTYQSFYNTEFNILFTIV